MYFDDLAYLLSTLTPRTALIASLVLGYILDLLLGDPLGWFHPVRLFGWLAKAGDRLLNHPSMGYLSLVTGMILASILCAGTWISFRWLETWLWKQGPTSFFSVNGLFVYFGLANRQLVREGKRVFDALNYRGLTKARTQLSRIVGRDTDTLGSRQIRIAVLESLAENLSDGSIAPLFYFALAGIPGMMTYKMINTLDSMVGYRTERHERFGKFAARLDDLVNLLPSRLTALLMVLVTASARGLMFTFRYGHRHKSPNAGYPEAALAGIIDARFGGPNYYQGVLVEKPYIGTNDRDIRAREIYRVGAVNHLTCLLMVVLVILLFIFSSTYPL